ncbi:MULTISPECIES: NADPH-dependent F420 reductase [unclassified Streptomyces]|uniref:NADPH-dependent F420 reductase n=1 Tax=unclassified Streptomyces TaxID=2593676 RepID=UPI000CD5C37C|nr:MULTISPECIES: NAD(P)-binding domain-containing protein [unclassified Streptomyces]
MSTLALIGSGNIGGTLARLAVAAGLDVVVSNSRGPETLAGLAEELGPRARAATAAEAAAAGDWVVVSVPLKHQDRMPAEPLAGKVVLDTTNYYPGRDGAVVALDQRTVTTSELLQRHLPASKVVKAFNNIFFRHLAALARPAGAPDRTALPIAGDDEAAKESATELLGLLGYDALDTGPLADSWRFERDTPAYVVPYAVDPADLPDDPGRPADAETLRAAVDSARRV